MQGQGALERLWALHACGGLTDETAMKLLTHTDPFVRAWTIRLICDQREVASPMGQAIAAAAGRESYIETRKQMASSARRLPPELALPVIQALLRYDEDAADIHQPLLIWWALETQAGKTDVSRIIEQILRDEDTWKRPLVVQYLAERLMKRYALAGTRTDLLQAAALLRAAPDRNSAELLLKGFEEAFQGRSLSGIPDELVHALAMSGGGSLALRFRQGQPDAVAEASQVISDLTAAKPLRRQLIEVAGQLRDTKLLPILIDLVPRETDASVLAMIFTALQQFESELPAPPIVSRYSSLPEDSRLAAEAMLVSRPAWTRHLLKAVDSGTIPIESVSDSSVRKMLLHNDPDIAAAVEKLWGQIAALSPAEVQAETDRVMTALSSGSGNPRAGKPLFMQNCGRCHLLFDEGGRIGPDLTPFARNNLERMLVSVINPSLEIREGFENHLVITTDGRILNGFLADKDNQVVILRGVDGQNVVLKLDDIDELKVIPQSVMPEGTLKNLTEQQLRDLFAYLRSTQPVN